MPFLEQTDREIYYAFKQQAVAGTPESGAGATIIPFVSSPGIAQENVNVQSQISRRDLLTQLGDYGQGSAPFNLNSELIVGAHDLIDQAVMRSSFTAKTDLDETNLGTITGVSGKTISFSGTAVLTSGVRVGDVHHYTTGAAAGDLNKPFIVVGATANSITYHIAPATSGTVAEFDLHISRNCIDGTTDRAFTVEEHFVSTDNSAVAEWLRFAEMTFSVNPNQPIQRSWRGRGRQMIPFEGGSAPVFTSPAEPTGLALSAANKTLIVDGSIVGKVSAFQVNYSRPDFLPPTSTPVAEDVGLGPVTLSGSVTILRDSMAFEQQYIQRLKGFPLSLLFVEPAVSGLPRFEALYMPFCRWTGASRSGAGRDGFTTLTLNFEAGVDERGGAFPKTMLKIASSYNP